LAQAGFNAFDRIGIHASEYIPGNLLQAYLQILERRAIVAGEVERLVVGTTFLPPFISGESSGRWISTMSCYVAKSDWPLP
jgi:hypothetical protein